LGKCIAGQHVTGSRRLPARPVGARLGLLGLLARLLPRIESAVVRLRRPLRLHPEASQLVVGGGEFGLDRSDRALGRLDLLLRAIDLLLAGDGRPVAVRAGGRHECRRHDGSQAERGDVPGAVRHPRRPLVGARPPFPGGRAAAYPTGP